jgi:uncharacterized secreted protein with C-terminal beta-propeller domain
MNTKIIKSIFVLFILISSGCLGIIENVNSDINDRITLLDEEYPQLNLTERIYGSPELINYRECGKLLNDLKNSVYDEMIVQLDQQSYYHWSPSPIIGGFFRDDVALDAESDLGNSAEVSGDTASSSDRNGEFSGTNNQETGVDEADFIKTDGHHIYMLNGDKFLVMEVPEFGDINLVSNVSMLGSPMQMMLEGDRVVITSSVNHWNLESDHPLLGIMGHEESYSYYDYSIDSTITNTYTRYENLVMYSVIDISNKSNPVVEEELFIEGNYHTARLVEGTVRSVTHLYTYYEGIKTWIDLPASYYEIEDIQDKMDLWNKSLRETINSNQEVINSLTLDDFVPQIYERNIDGSYTTSLTYSDDCSEFSASQNSSVRGLTTIITMKLIGEETDFEIDHVTSRWAHVYSSGNTLLLAEPVADWWWFWRNNDFEDSTNIHAFDISNSNSTSYLGSGRVSGTVQDQFSMSEFQGSIRIASTSDTWGRWWLESEVDENGDPVFNGPTNQVTILSHEGDDCVVSPCDSLIQIGILEDIAPNETIWSARFIGNKGYLVTFENIDPLWVIDLSNPMEPFILGELEVPGVSTYIHPVNENTLLTIGIGPGDDGFGLDWATTQISLFNVSDPGNPTLADSLPLSPAYTDDDCDDIRNCGWSWSWSEATYEHKAFTYWAPEELLAIPLSTYRYTYDESYNYNYEYISMLKLINVDVENLNLSTHGEVEHSQFYNNQNDWWQHSSTSIRRSIFMGDYIYAFSSLGVTVHNTSDMNLIEELLIPGQELPSLYYYDEEESETSEEKPAETSIS